MPNALTNLRTRDNYGLGRQDRQQEQILARQNAQAGLNLGQAQHQQTVMQNPASTSEQYLRAGIPTGANLATHQQNQLENAAGTLSRAFNMIAKAPANNRAMAASLINSQQFQTAAKMLGLPVDQMTVDENDTDESIKAESLQLFRALSGTPDRMRDTDIPPQIRTAEYYGALPPTAGAGEMSQDAFDRSRRGPNTQTIAGVEHIYTPNGWVPIGPGQGGQAGGVAPQPAAGQQPGATYDDALGAEVNAATQLAEGTASGRAAGSAGGLTLTPGQQKVDELFAADYTEWVAAGGYADVVKNASQLNEVLSRLEGGEQLTGSWRGAIPDWGRSFTNPRAIDTKALVEEVVQRNLRLILGAQFTEREGERLIARAFDDRQEEGVNASRVRRLLQQITDAARAKELAASHFGTEGTLSTFEGQAPTFSEYFLDPETDGPDIGTVQNGYQYIGGPPGDPNSWRQQ